MAILVKCEPVWPIVVCLFTFVAPRSHSPEADEERGPHYWWKWYNTDIHVLCHIHVNMPSDDVDGLESSNIVLLIPEGLYC